MAPAPDPRDEWASLDATAQAELVTRGEASPGELVEAACRRIERLDRRLGSVPIKLFEEALARAQALGREAPFAGVPFLMKDIGARQAGQPYYAANRALRAADYRAPADTPLGARFRETGLVTVGKSSTPEFGLQSLTWPLVYGPARNPWNPERSPGGSSGGACVAVAAGLVPVAHASDGAGSIRIPAAWCGLVGLKPTRDRIIWRNLGKGRSDIEFVVARSLRDTAAMLDVLRADRPAPGDEAEFSRALAERPPRLRIGVRVDAPDGSTVHPECRGAAERVAGRLDDLGHVVSLASPATLDDSLSRALHSAVLGMFEYRDCLDELALRLGRPIGAEDVEPYLWQIAHDFGAFAREDRSVSERWSREWAGRTLEWFDDYDLLLTPTVNEPAPRLRGLDPARIDAVALLERMAPHMAFTEPWNATGQPAISLPLAFSNDGMPIGVQLVARPGEEALLLRVAASLMDAAPDPSAPRPAVHA